MWHEKVENTLKYTNLQNAEDYKIFISGTKGNDGKVKKLCAHMIVRYWQDFTDLRNMAFYSLVSLLEDRDPDVLIFSHFCLFDAVRVSPFSILSSAFADPKSSDS